MTFPMNAGIYEIRNTITGRVYIGSTRYFQKRFLQHRTELKRGCHYCKQLQADWDRYGPGAFIMTLIEELPDPWTDKVKRLNLIEAERRHIIRAAAAGPVYNATTKWRCKNPGPGRVE